MFLQDDSEQAPSETAVHPEHPEENVDAELDALAQEESVDAELEALAQVSPHHS